MKRTPVVCVKGTTTRCIRHDFWPESRRAPGRYCLQLPPRNFCPITFWSISKLLRPSPSPLPVSFFVPRQKSLFVGWYLSEWFLEVASQPSLSLSHVPSGKSNFKDGTSQQAEMELLRLMESQEQVSIFSANKKRVHSQIWGNFKSKLKFPALQVGLICACSCSPLPLKHVPGECSFKSLLSIDHIFFAKFFKNAKIWHYVILLERISLC